MGRASWRYGHRRALALDQDAPQELAGHRPRQLVGDRRVLEQQLLELGGRELGGASTRFR
jgi:hypothetical protein